MNRRIFALAMVLVIAFGLLIPAAAFEDHNYLYVAVSEMDNQRLIDQGETSLPALSDQLQCSLALTDSAFSGNQQAFTVNVDQYPMNRNTRSQLYIQPPNNLCHKCGSCF